MVLTTKNRFCLFVCLFRLIYGGAKLILTGLSLETEEIRSNFCFFYFRLASLHGATRCYCCRGTKTTAITPRIMWSDCFSHPFLYWLLKKSIRAYKSHYFYTSSSHLYTFVNSSIKLHNTSVSNKKMKYLTNFHNNMRELLH